MTVNVVAKNLRMLRKAKKWPERRLAAKSGVSQKTINNIANQESSPTIETLDKLAAAFDLRGWQLLLPNLSTDVLENGSLENLVEHYSKAPPEGKEYISRIAEKEANYGT